MEKDKFFQKCLSAWCGRCSILSGKIFYCKNCKSNFCPDCLKGHNEVFFDHEVHETKEDLEYDSQENDKNSLLANPDLDLDDRGVFSDNKLPQIGQNESDKKLNELNIKNKDENKENGSPLYERNMNYENIKYNDISKYSDIDNEDYLNYESNYTNSNKR